MSEVNASNELPTVLLMGIDPEVEALISDSFKGVQVKNIPMNIDQLMELEKLNPCLALTGYPKEFSPVELAQTLRMQYQEAPLFFITQTREGFERKNYIKNGFTDAFLMPMDTTTLKAKVAEEISKATKGVLKVYKPVKIIDVEPGTVLDFETNVYLPFNKKYICLSNAGDSLDADRIERMKKSKFNSIQVPADQMPKFYQYSASRLRSMGDGHLSETEKREKLQGAVRDLVSGLFTDQAASFETGQAIMKDCGEIVKSFIMQGGEGDWFLKIQNVLGNRGDSYSHAGNVSTLAALFSMALGIGKPEDMALAGLLHDIGIAELPAAIQSTDPSKMTKEQFEIYKKHPEMSVNLIKARKIVVPEIVTKVIMQHHELYNGTGYPHGFFGDRICKEAQVLAIADRFDEMTVLVEGRPLLTPLEAIEKLRTEQVNDPSKIHFNADLLKELLTLFSPK
jgi:HD-GYP domain-containing protein (c-di-GMP phosphodiesterase class II)